jgi:hypothetical protein
MFSHHVSEFHRQRTPSFFVFGQTWQFSRPALSALNLYGIESTMCLKALIIKSGTSTGIEEGTHEIRYQGVELQLVVRGDQVMVVDPYAHMEAV